MEVSSDNNKFEETVSLDPSEENESVSEVLEAEILTVPYGYECYAKATIGDETVETTFDTKWYNYHLPNPCFDLFVLLDTNQNQEYSLSIIWLNLSECN